MFKGMMPANQQQQAVLQGSGQQQLRPMALNIGTFNGAQLFASPGGQQFRFAAAGPSFFTGTGQVISTGGGQALLNMGQFQVGACRCINMKKNL